MNHMFVGVGLCFLKPNGLSAFNIGEAGVLHPAVKRRMRLYVSGREGMHLFFGIVRSKEASMRRRGKG